MEDPEGKFILSDYWGTPAWLAPEVRDRDLGRFRGFSPELIFRFNIYSFRLVLLSIFTGGGKAPILDKDLENVPNQVFKLLYSYQDIPSNIHIEVRKAIGKLLTGDPQKQPLPGPDLIKTNSPAYAAW